MNIATPAKTRVINTIMIVPILDFFIVIISSLKSGGESVLLC